MLRYGIPKYKLEKEVIDAEIDIIRAMGVEIKCGVEVGKDITLDELRAQGYKAFYMAIGAQGGRKAGVDGEDADGVLTAGEFLHEAAENEKYDSGKNVVVVGGGTLLLTLQGLAFTAALKTFQCSALKAERKCLLPTMKLRKRWRTAYPLTAVGAQRKSLRMKRARLRQSYSRSAFPYLMRSIASHRSMMKTIPKPLNVKTLSFQSARQSFGRPA